MIESSDVLQRVDSALRAHPHLRSALIASRHTGDRVVLEGAVDSFFLKQMAQEAVREVAGPSRIDNQLRVRGSAPETAVSATTADS